MPCFSLGQVCGYFLQNKPPGTEPIPHHHSARQSDNDHQPGEALADQCGNRLDHICRGLRCIRLSLHHPGSSCSQVDEKDKENNRAKYQAGFFHGGL